MPVAATFSFRDEEGRSLSDVADVDTMVTVVDAANFLRDFDSRQSLNDRQMGVGDDDERTIVDLLTDQIEFANVIVINKCDLVSEADAERLEGILKHLNPDARTLRVSRGKVDLGQGRGTGLYDEEAASRMPGWVKELNGEHIPRPRSTGFQASSTGDGRFHPDRLMRALGTGLEGVVRSKGYLWLASRPDCGIWSQAGASLQMDAGYWFAPNATPARRSHPREWTKAIGTTRSATVEIVFIEPAWTRDDRGDARRGPDLGHRDGDGTGRAAAIEDPLPSWDVEDEHALEVVV